ncbi:hypothetical protein tinsulaeT_38450 [Thalassotalea insulae]|uniref:diguanylate cyclase n=1 Tax=Thalassotalea insulae TaxID=2056778 RepID=A0ABQ6GX43_9GAMM|nr:sensor domain-containing diguanylate cyclase [Thalassotalea insulae]GLX80505.1 hypothetical protein tinsulaeT_38450 [Thalassotalea insulae]
MKSFRTVLTALLWLFAIVPVIWLSFNQLHTSKHQAIEFGQQQLILDVNEKLTKLRTNLESSFSALDRIASDGSIITSSTVDIMSVKVINQLQSFLDNYPSFSNIMMLDRELFQIEARPNQALAIDLSPFSETLNTMFNDEKTINEPNVKILIVPDSNGSDNYLFAAARPILHPKESLITPFEVTGMLFTTLPLEQFINALLNTIGSKQQGQISLYQHQKLIYQNKTLTLTDSHISYQTNFVIGNNDPFTIEVVRDLSSELSFSALISKEQENLIYTLMLLAVILISAKFIIKRLIQPIDELKQLTQQITQIDWHSNQAVIIDTTAHYKEFHELKQLLHSMSQTIQQQFNSLSNNNLKLTSLTEALQSSVKQGDTHKEILQNLINYDLHIRRQEDIEVIGCLTLGLAFGILNEPIGLVIYRSNFQSGFTSLERANPEFLHYIEQQHLEKIHLDLDEIHQINQLKSGYHLTAIHREKNCLGYIVTPKIDQQSFQARSIEIFVTSLQSRLQELQLQSELSKLANTDALTGLFSRHYFEQTYAQFKQRFLLRQEHFAVMLIDINGLKQVNDTLGHDAGDQLIKAVANFLQQSFRTSDIIARIGGDEFIILLEHVNVSYCQPFAIKLMEEIQQQHISYLNKKITLSFSCGYATSHEDPVEQLVELADQRMYQIKQQNKIHDNPASQSHFD